MAARQSISAPSTQFLRQDAGTFDRRGIRLPARKVVVAVRAAKTFVYTVEKGDNLHRISSQYGVSVPDIQVANEVANENVIYAGQQLLIPTVEVSKPPPVKNVKTWIGGGMVVILVLAALFTKSANK
ncbi:hypothetical protein CYMTET_25022 [Cymbomonas tetramitiformis]|uniref:LysM domain-containing protein n=1 Tax=Cymbomonas tetramitiformis TaxID=36881 RepID=A0AAE0FVF6_9CHLO|nr:hypothetical protein CYMTET_25022 [Cymbomonas tetramitiformis]|eukprot:gene17493-20830_t